jgi:putative ABC transport system ATP-binding protein
MIAYDNISIRVHQQTLFDVASLRVCSGEKVVVRGPSGCGKSSLIKSTVGAVPLVTGMICVEGIELSAETVSDIRARIAFIGQEPVLGAENVRDAILLPFSFKAHSAKRPPDDRIMELLERFHLSQAILDKPCSRISGGEKQRIAILRALLLAKTIFLADEITSALDPESRTAVMTELFRPEITLLSVSHDPEWINTCDRKIEIVDAQLKESVADPKIGNQQSEINNPSTGGAP